MFVDRYYFQNHRVSWAAAGFITGLVLLESKTGWCLMLLMTALAVGCWYWRREPWQQLALFGALLLLGCWVMHGQLAAQNAQSTQVGNRVCLAGTVAESKKGQPYFWLQVEGKSLSAPNKRRELLYVSVPQNWATDKAAENVAPWYPAGSKVQVEGVIAAPQGQRNPGGFNEAFWLRSKQARYKLQAQGLKLLQEPEGIWRVSLQLRSFMEQTVRRCLSAAEADTALALLLGEKQQLEQSFYRLTQRMGTAHIFAVSGLHVGFVGAMLLYLLRLGGWERSWLAFLLLSVSLAFYCLLTGLPPSAVRAALMIILAALALRLLRPIASLDFLAAAALFILLDNPFVLWTAGFQLSFGVTLSLLLFTGLLQQKLSCIPWVWLRSSIAVALAAYLGSLPFSAWHFYTASLLSPLFNLILVPVVSVLVPLLLLAFVLTFLLPAGGAVFFFPIHLLLQLLLRGTVWLQQSAGSGHWYIGRPPVLAFLLYLLLLLFLWQLLHRKNQHLLYGQGIVGCAVCIIWLCLPVKPAVDTLTYLDGGQGSCAVLRTSAGETIIFDGGAQQRELASCLAWYGVNRVDAIVLSHCDTDHVSGIPQVLENLPVGYLFAEQQQLQRQTARETVGAAHKLHVAVKPIQTGGTIQLARGRIELQVYDDHSNGTNCRELTAVVQLPCSTIAFPGDLALEGVLPFVAEQERITVWTVPHHGSRYSFHPQLYQLLQEKGMKRAVISAGLDNRYGHPHQEVLQQLQKQGTAVYRTDKQGAVILYLKE